MRLEGFKSMPTRPFATAVVRRLTQAGHIAYFAGGWVRDFLMKTPSDDIDIATSARVEEVQALFPRTVPVGIAFGIVIVIEEGHPFEVATFRQDQGYVDGRRPTGIAPATPKEDALRRDFTINGMFYDPLQERLYDYVGGQNDIQEKKIRAIGNPHERFLEDRLRMMRAVRYATRFGFSIEQATEHAIIEHAPSLLPAVAMERIWQEFKKMSKFAHFDEGLIALHRLGLLPVIFPRLKGQALEVVQQQLLPLKDYPTDTPAIAELLELFPNDSLEELVQLCEYLKLSNQEKELVTHFHHIRSMLSMPEDWQRSLEPIEWAQFYARPHANLFLRLFEARLTPDKKIEFRTEHALRQEKLLPWITRIQQKNPVVRAEDLILAGILPGPVLGKCLKEAERISVNLNLEDKAAIISMLQKSSS